MYVAGYIKKVKRRVPHHDCSDTRVWMRGHVWPLPCTGHVWSVHSTQAC